MSEIVNLEGVNSVLITFVVEVFDILLDGSNSTCAKENIDF